MPHDNDVDRSQVLVIGNSSVNRVVVSRIVERMGLKAAATSPDRGAEALAAHRPAIVILDGGAGDGECDALFPALAASRRARAALPAVILLSSAIEPEGTAASAAVVDMTVAKPITVDRLQPAIEALMARNGDFSMYRP